MQVDSWFFLNSVLFGVGLAMDAFSVSLANGLDDAGMRKRRMSAIAGTFAVFQTLMPLLGWICIHTIASVLEFFEKLVPWIALVLLLLIGGKMLFESIRGQEEEGDKKPVSVGGLMLQGIATSIDALSVGFTIAYYDLAAAVLEALIIGVVTFIICIAGLKIGKKIGTSLSGKASVLGGLILMFIGAEIFIKGMFFS